MPKEKSVKDRFIENLEADDSIDWSRKFLSTRTLIMDALYILGVSLNKERYSNYSGFEKFLKENEVELNLQRFYPLRWRNK